MFSLLTRTRSDLCNPHAVILLRDTRPRPLKGETPVTWAVAAGNLAAVSALVDLNADPLDQTSIFTAPTSDRGGN